MPRAVKTKKQKWCTMWNVEDFCFIWTHVLILLIRPLFWPAPCLFCMDAWLKYDPSLCPEIDRIQKGETKKEAETYLDLFTTKNIKLKERVLIPVKQYPKVRILCPCFASSSVPRDLIHPFGRVALAQSPGVSWESQITPPSLSL